MGITDWLILAILFVFVVQGFRKGLAAALVRIAGAVCAFLLFGQAYPLVRNGLLINYKLSPLLSTIFAIVLIALLFFALASLVIYILNKLIKAASLSFINKSLGALLGLVTGLLAVMVMMVLLDYFPALTRPLKVPEKHRVYVAVDTLKEDLFTKLKLEQRDLYRQIRDKAKEDKEAAAAGQ